MNTEHRDVNGVIASPVPTQSAGRVPTGTSRRIIGGSALLYLVLSIALWWGVWSGDPTSTTTCGCGDAARFIWFFEWPAYAISHGHSVLYSQALFHPTGINLLNDTSVLLLGIVLAPVTWLFGPVAAMNVALTLAPMLSALAMLLLLRRWVTWTPAAVFGGLVYGFSPFLITELAYNQINIGFLAIPPLIALVLDDLLIRQCRSPRRNGVLLAGLLVAQFFLSTEVLVITVVTGFIAVIVVAIYAAICEPGALRIRRHGILQASAVTFGIVGIVLAYPLWFLLAGPAHLSGPIWSNGPVSQFGTTFTDFFGGGGSSPLVMAMRHFGGYQGSAPPTLGYLGTGVVVVTAIGAIVWCRDRRLWLFGALGLIAGALSLSPGRGYWVPWELVEKLPWLGDVVELRFTLVIMLCLSVMVAVVVDRVHASMVDRAETARSGDSPRSRPIVVASLVAVVALVPSLVALGPNLTLTTQPVVLPHWFQSVGPTLPANSVVLAYPAPFAGVQSSMTWQAVNRMQYSMAGGGGPEGVVSRAGTAKDGFAILSAASFALSPAPLLTAASLSEVRLALADWKVTTVVVPDQPGLPSYDQGRGGAYAVGFFTAVLGVAPRYEHTAWVWSLTAATGSSIPISPSHLATCTAPSMAKAPSHLAVATCVLNSVHP